MTKTVVHPATAVDDAWEAAYKDAVVTPLPVQIAYLLSTIGPRFTTVGVGLNDTRTVRRWRDEGIEPREHHVAARVSILYRLTRAVADVYSPAVAMAFLRSANPQLDDTSPLALLSEGDPDLAQKALLAAARAFLEG